MNIPWRKIVPNGGRVFIGGGASVPRALMRDLLADAGYFHDVELCHIHTVGELPWIDLQYKGSFRTNTFFMSADMRVPVEQGHADYTPCAMSDVPRLFSQGVLKLDVAVVQVSPPNAQGQVSLGLSADVVWAAVKNARVVVAQINPKMPWTYGDTVMPLKYFNYTVEVAEELTEREAWVYREEHHRAAKYASQLIEDGSIIQTNLGLSPQAVLQELRDHRHLGIHTGSFTNDMMELVKAGAVDNSTKLKHKGISVATHVLGSQELYDFVNQNKEIELRRSEWTNNPQRIGGHRRMVAINGAREVDLTGQVVRDSRGHHFYGGIGAIQDFIRGSAMSRGGRPIIVMTSTDDEKKRSRIVTGLTTGSGVCTSRGDVHYVVTEFGVANLVGQSIRQRVLRLVEIAHPKFRESLLEGARRQGWIPKTFGFSPKEMDDTSSRLDTQSVKFRDVEYIVRPLHPSDLRLLQEFFYAQDEETLRLRYGHSRPEMDEESAYRLSSVDQSKDLAMGVFYRDNLREDLRAVARFYVDAKGDSAEISFLVHERARRRGVANFLLTEMARIADQRGIKVFWASVLKKNESMKRLFLSRGAEEESHFGEDSNDYFLGVKGLLGWRHVSRGDAAAARKKADKGFGWYRDEEFLKHDGGPGYPESQERYQALLDGMRYLRGKKKRIKRRVASVEEITLAHTAAYHDRVMIEVDEFAEVLSTGDTALCPESYDVAALASGVVIEAIDQIAEGKISRAFCAVRPPGHHASVDVGMGFCIFNHVAVAARYAQKKHGLRRVAILDWDVHHGNGTQDIFYEDGSVFYFSSHEEGLFPYTGRAHETGSGEGAGTTYNVPLPKGSGDEEMLQCWGEPLEQKLKFFKPELIIISAGFDAAAGDPLADLEMTENGFTELTKLVCGYADKFCHGRLLSVLEGGYDPPTLVKCAKAHLRVMIEASKVVEA